MSFIDQVNSIFDEVASKPNLTDQEKGKMLWEIGTMFNKKIDKAFELAKLHLADKVKQFYDNKLLECKQHLDHIETVNSTKEALQSESESLKTFVSDVKQAVHLMDKHNIEVPECIINKVKDAQNRILEIQKEYNSLSISRYALPLSLKNITSEHDIEAMIKSITYSMNNNVYPKELNNELFEVVNIYFPYKETGEYIVKKYNSFMNITCTTLEQLKENKITGCYYPLIYKDQEKNYGIYDRNGYTRKSFYIRKIWMYYQSCSNSNSTECKYGVCSCKPLYDYQTNTWGNKQKSR